MLDCKVGAIYTQGHLLLNNDLVLYPLDRFP